MDTEKLIADAVRDDRILHRMDDQDKTLATIVAQTAGISRRVSRLETRWTYAKGVAATIVAIGAPTIAIVFH